MNLAFQSITLLLAGFFIAPTMQWAFRIGGTWFYGTILAILFSVALFLPPIGVAILLESPGNGLVKVIALLGGAGLYRILAMVRHRPDDGGGT